MTLSYMGKELPKEKKWGIRNCRERKCPELRKNEDTAYPEDAQERCQVFNTMPGTLPCCIKDLDNMPPEEFLRHASWHLHDEWEKGTCNRKNPGPKNCPKTCPYKISEQGEVFKKATDWKKVPGTIWRCAFTGGVLGQDLGGSCHCHVLDNPEQDRQIETIRQAILHRFGSPFNRAACDVVGCPDGIIRCKAGDIICPVIKLPFIEIKECPLWRIPAKLLPAIPQDLAEPAKPDTIVVPSPAEVTQKEKEPSRKLSQKEKPAPIEKKRKKKETEDLICKACRERSGEPVPDHACAWCKEEQEKKGRRAWVSSLQLGQVHLGDMEILGEQIPDESVDVIFTDPPYVKELYEVAYARLAELACRALKPHGFLITYAPQTHLDEIMDFLRYSNVTSKRQVLRYFWIISSLNGGKSTAKNHQRNAICLHKPILVFQKAPEGAEMKGSRRCFADVVRGLRQKRYHPWQQSIHDVLGIISRFMDPGEILLDPYAGTGTSLIAANLLGMEWIGFEIDPKTHAIAVRELQQQPIALGAFGVEVLEAPEVREQIEPPKDGSKQGKITSEERSRIDKPDSDIKTELPEACEKCEAVANCSTHDPKAGCVTATLEKQPAAKKPRTPKKSNKPVEEKQAAAQDPHCCDTCIGGYSTPDIITMDCPDYPDVSNGTIDQEHLRASTRRLGCTFWAAPGTPPRIPNWAWCVGTRSCKSLSSVDGVCTKTGQKLKEMTYCPTQYLIGKTASPSAKCMSATCKKCKGKTKCSVPFDRGCISCKFRDGCGNYGHPEKGCSPEGDGQPPYVQKCCGTCGHHKGRKTFHPSCPRLGELLFKGGTKSAKVLMDETAATPCKSWTDIPGDLYVPEKIQDCFGKLCDAITGLAGCENCADHEACHKEWAKRERKKNSCCSTNTPKKSASKKSKKLQEETP